MATRRFADRTALLNLFFNPGWPGPPGAASVRL